MHVKCGQNTFVGIHLSSWWRLYPMEELVNPVHPPKPLLLEPCYLLAPAPLYAEME